MTAAAFLLLGFLQIPNHRLVDARGPILLDQPPVKSLAGRNVHERFGALRFERGGDGFAAGRALGAGGVVVSRPLTLDALRRRGETSPP